MLKLSKKTDYAIILLCHLSGAESSASAQEIAQTYNIQQPMVANILKKLSKAKLVRSVRGQHGGYVLDTFPNMIKLSDIISATENPFNLVECAHDSEICKVNCCPSRAPLISLNKKIQQFIEETTLASIVMDSVVDNSLTQQTIHETTGLS